MTSASTGLLEEWLKKVEADATQALQNMEPKEKAKQITESMKKSLQEEWEKLRARLKVGESLEIKDICSKDKTWSGINLGPTGMYKVDLCKGVVELRYFTAGLKKKDESTRQTEVENSITETQWYPRCLVGAVALSEIYGDHCQLKEIVDEISREVEEKLRTHWSNDGTVIKKCEGKVDGTTLMLAKALLHDQIEQWTRENRKPGSANAWRVRMPWHYWQTVCKQGALASKSEHERKKHYLQENKDTVGSFLNIGSGSDRAQLMEELIKEEDILTFDDLQTVLEKSMSNGAGGTATPLDFSTIMKNLEGIVEKNK
ncbi:SICAvar, type I (fragment), partial [Plasmodium knowlesi strain H]